MPAYMVQGFFFQERESLGIAMKPIEGAVAVINRGMFRDMFAGMIWWDDFSGDWTGEMSDAFGQSSLESVHVSSSAFRFEKRYERRSDSISYEFELNNNGLWMGRYSGEQVGEGCANSILTPIPDAMLECVLS